MKKLFIIKAGTTFPATARKLGDFDAWTVRALGNRTVEVCVLDAENGALMPDACDCAGVVITGSHSMVTDNLPWSLKLEQWIQSLLAERVPILGICYGHQLLARAAGGQVGFHPAGEEIGTVPIRLLSVCCDDKLFRHMPSPFWAHVSHSQTVLSLPPGAVRLAQNEHEPNHAYRLGDCAWGVQFHPEYTTDIMRSYIEAQAGELQLAGLDIHHLLKSVTDTPFAAETLRGFTRIAEST